MALQNLRREFRVAVSAIETAIRVNTDETSDAIAALTTVCQKKGWELRVWDHVTGMRWYNGQPRPQQPVSSSMGGLNTPPAPTPLGVLLDFLREPPAFKPDKPDELLPVILVMVNFQHSFDTNLPHLCSAIQHLVQDKAKNHARYPEFEAELRRRGISADGDLGKFLVAFMPREAQLPAAVRPLFKIIDHELPDLEEMASILDGVIDPASPLLSRSAREKVCRHALGMTRQQATGVFAAAVIRLGDQPGEAFDEAMPRYVWEQKAKIFSEDGLVHLYQGKETFPDVVGLGGLKTLMTDLLTPDPHEAGNPDIRARGLCAVGPPRTGKSLMAKAAGNSLGLPTFMVDVGALFGSLVGESEAKTRRLFQILRVNSPCIAVID